MKTAACMISLGITGLLLLLSLSDTIDGQQTSAAQPKNKIVTNSIGMKLAYIPAGTFVMGSPESEPEREAEELQHKVEITRPFYIGVYEVKQSEFMSLMKQVTKRGAIFNEKRGGGPEYPMENMEWYHAEKFCEKLSDLPAEKKAGRRYRLPTEAEWEYACRAGTKTVFAFGDSLSSKQANFNGNFPFGDAPEGPYVRQTVKVGSYAPNAWGLYDMHGNVAEWCSDFYDKDYYKRSPRRDPQGPKKGVVPTDYNDFYRVIRGGCWLDEARACRSAYRYRAMPKEPYRLIGFRVVCETAE